MNDHNEMIAVIIEEMVDELSSNGIPDLPITRMIFLESLIERWEEEYAGNSHAYPWLCAATSALHREKSRAYAPYN